VTANVSIESAGSSAKGPSREHRLLGLGLTTFGLYIINALLQQALATPSGSGVAARQALLYGLYLLVTVGTFALYWMLLAMCRRGELTQNRPRAVALGMACVLQAVLAMLTPRLSQDMLTYIAQGLLGMLPGHSPLAEPASAAQFTLPGAALIPAGWRPDVAPSAYGIIWIAIETASVRLAGGNLQVAMWLLKGVVLAASLLTALMLGRFLGRVAPHARQLGVLAYLWNPLILVELAGEGHNDALMVLFAVAALAACAAGQVTASVLAQLSGVLTKYVNLLLVPPQLVYLWRTRRGGGARLILEIAAGVVIAGALAAALYAPLWIGLHSFAGTVQQGAPVSSASLFGIINWVLRRSSLAPFAAPITVAAVGLPSLVFIVWISLGVRDALGLAHACAWIAVVFVLVTAPLYWPWYACLPVSLLIAADVRRYLWVIFMLCVLARMVAPLELLQVQGLLSMPLAKGTMTGLGTTLPLVVLLVWVVRRARPAVRASARSKGLATDGSSAAE